MIIQPALGEDDGFDLKRSRIDVLVGSQCVLDAVITTKKERKSRK